MAEITFNGTVYIWTQCGSCGVWYVVPKIMRDNHYRKGGFSHCPSGHAWGWREGQAPSDFDKLRRERDRLQQDAARLNDEIEVQRRRADVAEKRTLQIRRRAVAGVCPCCNRTFANVQRHMKTKHANVVSLEQKSG